ncbi:MAG: tetratricopeptide repeat protein [Oligoflexales bacterium]|nr:tetratricopeptide repeat protein [Oligoflexales bacterium]
MFLRYLLTSILLLLVSCETISNLFSSSDPKEIENLTPITEKKSLAFAADSNEEDIHYKIAKLWARVDDLNIKLKEQEEKVSVIEKSFALGLSPNRPETESKIEDFQTPLATNDHEDTEIQAPPKSAPSANVLGESSIDDSVYEAAFAKVHEFYRLGNYGRAIVELNELRKKYGETYRQGMHIYWIGKCWIGLREYESARTHLESFIAQQPNSPYLARAEFDLARVYHLAGQRNLAVKLLKKIIDSYPTQEVADMAKLQLETMQQDL